MSQIVRFGLMGYGAWGAHHARVIGENPRAVLAAVSARTPASLDRAAADHPAAKRYADYHEMLAREELDVVVIVLPTDLHHAAATAALESGHHLLLEKPMAPSLTECDGLIALAARQNKLLAIGHELRLSSLWGEVKRRIDAGDIGEPQAALIELWRRPYRLGADGWRYAPARVGNWILEEPIHFFDLARWYLSSQGDPVSVFAHANSRANKPGLQDNFTAMLRFKTGAYATVCQTLAGWEHHQVAKVTGREGALWATWGGALDRTFHPTFSLRHQRSADGPITAIPISKITGEVYELADQVELMIRAVADGEPLLTTGADGRWSVAMCLAAQRSVDTAAEVRFGSEF